MKSLVLAAATLAVLGAAAPALAQPMSLAGISAYGNLGVEDFNIDNHQSLNIGAVTGRVGARIGPYFGVEGEVSGGFNGDHTNVGGLRSNVTLRDQYAAYAVGFLPIMPNADLLARIGYGASNLHVTQPFDTAYNRYETTWNAGVGGQYFFTPADGVRLDYTRETADRSDLDANVFSAAYVRKF